MRWKWIAATVFFLIIALVAAIYVFLYTFDYNKLKPRIARMVKDATGRELNIGGEIDLAIGLRPALVVTDISFANASWGSQPQMIKIDKLQAQVRLLPLLTKDVELSKIALAGVAVLLETKPDGQGNWELPADESSAKDAGTSALTKISVDNIRLENLDLTFRDGKTGSATHVNLTDLKVAEQTGGDKLAVDLRAEYNGQPLTLAGQTGLVRELLESERFPVELSGSFADAAIELEGAVDDVLKLTGINLKVHTSGKNLAELKLARNIQLPKTTAFDLTGHLRGSKESLALSDLSGTLSGSDVNLAFSGNVGDLIAINGIDLQLKGSGKDLTEIGTIIDRKLPATDEFSLEGRLTGAVEALSLMNAQVTARRGRMHLALNGGVNNLLTLRGLDLQTKLTGTDLVEFGEIIGVKLPATDQFEIQGRLAGSVKTLSLKQADGSAKWRSVSLALKGEIKNLLDLGGLDLHLRGSGKNLAEMGPITGRKLPPTDAFFLEGRLTGSGRTLSLLEAQGLARRGSLSLEATGGIKDLAALTGMDLRLKAGGKELAEIGPLVGTTIPQLGPFNLNGHLSGSAKSFSLVDLTAVVDRSDFNGRAKVEVRKRPKITLVLDSSLLDMTALLKNLGKDEKKVGPAPGGLEGRLFRKDPLPLDVLKQVDADISLNAKNVRARDANFEFGRLILTLENGDLNVDTLQASYKQTRISGNFHLFPESPPRVVTKFLVQDFDLGGLLRELRLSEEVRSHLDIAVDVKSRGGSIHDLMAGLDGSVGAVMGQGYLTRYLDLLSVGLTQKVFQFWGRHKKGGEIRCAVVQFDVSSGIATSKAFVFDTEAGVLTGEGDIDLATEQVNFLLVPEPRHASFTNLWTKLRVSGPIMDPKVRPDTLSLLTKGAKALSALVIGPLGLLAPFVSLGAHKAHPCNVHSIGK